jgi:arabinofuranan 3-O-arabinosyltransferase
VHLLDRADGGRGHRMDVVLTRLRYDPGEPGRHDQERSLQRSIDLPDTRTFGVTGTIRVQPNAPDAVLDAVLSTDLGGATVTASSHLTGDLGSRASRALDDDLRTSWQAAFGPQDGQGLTVRLAQRAAVRDLVVQVVADDRHSVPRSLTLLADGEPVGTVPVPEPDGAGPIPVALPDPPAAVEELQVMVGDVRSATSVPGDLNPAAILPVALAELDGTGLPVAFDAAVLDPTCRALVAVDDQPVSVRAVGSPADARRGLALEPCDGDLTLAAGVHTISTVIGVDEGLDVDRLVLSSGAEGSATEVAPRGAPRSGAGAEVDVRAEHRGTDYNLRVRTDGEPFWLVLGQSDNRGWDLHARGATVGDRQIVDGYANGWLITPEGAGVLSMSVTWEPQRLVWTALVLSGAAVLACLAILVVGGRRQRTKGHAAAPMPPDPTLADPPPGRGQLTPGVPGLAVAVGVGTLLVATPLAAVVASAAVVAGLLLPRATWIWAVAAPGLVLAAGGLDRPELAWLALALVAADLVVERWTDRTVVSSTRVRDRPAAPGG